MHHAWIYLFTVIQEVICKSEKKQIGLQRHLHAVKSTDEQELRLFNASVIVMEMINNAAVLQSGNPYLTFHSFLMWCSLSLRWHRGRLSTMCWWQQLQCLTPLEWRQQWRPRRGSAVPPALNCKNAQRKRERIKGNLWSNWRTISTPGPHYQAASPSRRHSHWGTCYFNLVWERNRGMRWQRRAEGGPESSLNHLEAYWTNPPSDVIIALVIVPTLFSTAPRDSRRSGEDGEKETNRDENAY